MIRQRTDDVVQTLADQHYRAILRLPLLQSLHPPALEPRLYYVLEIFLAQQIQTILADASEKNVEHAGGKDTVGGIEQRANQCR